MLVKRRFINGELVEHTINGVDQLEGREPLLERAVSKQWPMWAKALKRFAKPEDKGIGDVVRRKIGDETSDAFKKWHKTVFGKDCGCTGRQKKWNRMYPLS